MFIKQEAEEKANEIRMSAEEVRHAHFSAAFRFNGVEDLQPNVTWFV